MTFSFPVSCGFALKSVQESFVGLRLTCMMIACKNGHAKVVELCLKAGADVHSKGTGG